MIEVSEDTSASAETQTGSAETLARHEPKPPIGLLLIESASEEHGTEPSGTQALLFSSSEDLADAIQNTADEDLSMYVRQMYWDNAQFTPPLPMAEPDPEYIRFRGKVVAALLDEPIDDGVTHPVEGVIDEALRADSSKCQDWLSQVLVEHYPTRPSLCASIVRCIGRIDYDRVRGWGMRVADHALRNKDVEVRDAAVRALEDWGGSEALDMLRRHEDAVAWLNEYVQQVIVDLSGTTS